MTKAPEQVTLARKLGEKGLSVMQEGETMSMGYLDAVKYTRTDVAQAMVAAAYEVAAGRFDEIARHDQGGIDYSDMVGIPICNRAELEKSVRIAESDAKALRALTPTDARAALDRLIAQAVKEALTVKPLVWINRPNDPQGYTWKAKKPFGSAYYLHEKDGLHSWGGDYIPLEEAKAAAQADHEARILSALKGGEA